MLLSHTRVMVRPGGGNLPTGGRTDGTRSAHPHRRRRVGGAGGEEGGLPAELLLWTDGSRDENGAVVYAVASRKGQSWAGRKAQLGYYQEVYDAECAAIVRVAAKRCKFGSVRIFTDGQAAIKRMTHDEPGPGQAYALQARQAIAALCKQEPAVEIGIR